jgi:hypothetical protein
MKNKVVIILTTFLMASNINLKAQTYYNPREEINITLTIKEPYKPVNYYEIGNNFNNMLQEEVAKREALKRYYDQIYFETKNSVSANTYLTDDNDLNQKILLLQNATLENLDRQNSSLKMGFVKPDDYERNLRTCYYNYINNNQIFLNLCRFKYLKLVEYKSDSLKNVFNSDFKTALKSITNFKVEVNSIEFNVEGLAEYISATEKKSINQLYMFITNVCEGNLALYQSNWKEISLIREEKAKTVQAFNDQWVKMVSEIMVSRDAKLQPLDEKEKKKYLKNEREYLDNILGTPFMNYHFGKGRRFVYQIENNGRKFINITKYETEKVNQRSMANLFYKCISEFCKCGNYDPSLFD